jgi:catechol 2,3-dioxygenase-like lactoylglutathione lyase family enzyme
MQLTGIHHLTAISAKPRQNLAFYTGLLSMRLVKKTVNQDDVSAYPFALRRRQNQSRHRLWSAIANPSRCRD